MYAQRYSVAHLRNHCYNGKCYSVAHSRNHCYNGNTTVHSPFIAIGVDVAVNNIKVFTVTMELQQWVLLHCCRAIQYFVLLTRVSIIHYQCVSVFLPSLSQIASFCAVWYCHMWTVCLYYNFPHYLTNGTIFWKILLKIMCFLSTTFVWNIFHSKKNRARYYKFI